MKLAIALTTTSDPKYSPRPKGRFRPPSRDDFAQRAESMAWVLGSPLQTTQNILARVYGYEDLHDLQKDLAHSANSPADHPPGPYEEEVLEVMFGFINEHSEEERKAFLQEGIWLHVVRNNFLIEVANNYAASTGDLDAEGKMPARFWEIREIGLFATPEKHRNDFRKIKQKYGILDEVPSDAASAHPTDYAYPAPTATNPNEFVLAFTRKGAAVFGALKVLSDALVQNGDHEAFMAGIAKIKEAHPNNPWVYAVEIDSMGPACWQLGWTEGQHPDHWSEPPKCIS
jgi:hypothetical protein